MKPPQLVMSHDFTPERKRSWGLVECNPNFRMFALNSHEIRLATFLRFGLSIPLSDWMTTCNCGATLDGSGYHLLTCKSGGGPVWSHEAIASTWPDCLRELNVHHRREPQHRYLNSNDRPDIVASDPDKGCNVDLDIALAHSWSSDIFQSHLSQMVLLQKEEKRGRK